MDTDYDNYSIVFGESNNETQVWVLTRAQKVDRNHVEPLVRFAASKLGLDLKDFVFMC